MDTVVGGSEELPEPEDSSPTTEPDIANPEPAVRLPLDTNASLAHSHC